VFNAVAFFYEAEAGTVCRVQLVEKSKSKMKCPPTLSDASLDHKVSEVAPFTLTLAFEHRLSEIIDHREIQLKEPTLKLFTRVYTHTQNPLSNRNLEPVTVRNGDSPLIYILVNGTATSSPYCRVVLSMHP
ncbi:hypothetical protein Tco_1512563, partial [Tanacetum coccineum]